MASEKSSSKPGGVRSHDYEWFGDFIFQTLINESLKFWIPGIFEDGASVRAVIVIRDSGVWMMKKSVLERSVSPT